MKPTKTFLLISSFLAVGFLAGCVEEGGTETIINESKENNIIENLVSEADQIAFDGAVSMEDTALCDKIVDQSFKNLCKSFIEENKKRQLAVTNADPGLCEELADEAEREACKMEIEISAIQNEAIIKQKELRETSLSLANEIIESGNAANCNQIEVDDLRRDCEFMIISKEAINTNDINICGKLEDERLRKICLISFEDSMEIKEDANESALAPPF